MTMIREVGLFLSLLLSSVVAQDSNCKDNQWLPENYIYNPGNECAEYDGSRIPNCSAFIFPGNQQPYYHLHEYDCSRFWECGPAGETCLFDCAPCGNLCPGWNGLSFDCRYQYPAGPVCDFPVNVNCNNHIPCPSCDVCEDWQSCDESTGCVCTPECKVDAHCDDDQYCAQDGKCKDGCRSSEGCVATVCSDCINNQCVDPNCCADEDCPNGVCLNGECEACIVDDDCNVNGGCATCAGNQCWAPDCCVDDDCPDGVCLDGSCVECVVDNDCNANGGCSSCKSNQCVAPQCCTDDDCQIGEHCNLGFCEGECNINDNCPNGGSDALCDVPIYNECQYCNAGSHLCEQGCDADTNCPSDYPVCNPNHSCGCSDTSDCWGSEAICNQYTVPGAYNCAYCDPSNAQCKPGCDTDLNCPADFPVCQADHTCGCSYPMDCEGNQEICNIGIYDNCAYCDASNAQCKPGCVNDANCPGEFPVCQADHKCGCSDGSDCAGNGEVCEIDTYNNCAYCDSVNAQCKPGCATDSNCPGDFPVCQDDHTCGCSDGSDCVGNGEICNTDAYDNCAYCDADNAQCKPGCATDSNCPSEFPVCQADHTCGCSYPMDCVGNGEVCNTDLYDNCAYCDVLNAQCKPGCVNDANCPSDFPVCQADHTCGCTVDSDCQGSNWMCDVQETPYSDCEYCNLDDSQCQPGCIQDFNCPPSYICGEDHLCILDGECDSIRPCVDDSEICDFDYSNCFYCDLNGKTCEPGCEENSECVAFGSNYICNPSNQCQAVGVSGIINITVNTYTCEGCPASGGFATKEGGLQVTLDGGMLECSTHGLDNLDRRDYDNGITAFFDADQLEETDGSDDDGMGQCRGADLNLRLDGGTATWTGTGTWTGSSQIPICINFFGDYKPTCCCELEDKSLAQGDSTNLVGCECCASPPCT